MDEPGLSTVFSALSGYNDMQAKDDFARFFNGIEGPKGLHLCAAVDLRYLLGLGVDILSFDAFKLEFMPREYGQAMAEFINNGGIIAWGIVSTDSTSQSRRPAESLASIVYAYWSVVTRETGIPVNRIAENAILAPTRCCLIDIGLAADSCPINEETNRLSNEERLVERSFTWIKQISEFLQDNMHL